jgi:hypothetical protein
MALAFITATMLVSTVIVEALDLFDDAEAKKGEKNCNECAKRSFQDQYNEGSN